MKSPPAPSRMSPRRWTERQARASLVIAATLLAAGGVAVAVWGTCNADDGGRGGALAVALTLAAFFLRRDLGLAIGHALTQTAPAIDRHLDQFERADAAPTPSGAAPVEGPPATVEALQADLTRVQAQLTALEAGVQVDAESERKMLVAVALASLIGTLTWGFGDLLAAALLR